MATFRILLRTKIARIPGHPHIFHRDEEYSTTDPDEIRELRSRDHYTVEEITSAEEAESDPNVSQEPPEKPQLEQVLDKRAIRDEMLTTPTDKLKKRKFKDGTRYGSLWVAPMNKQRFIKLVMERLEQEENA